MQHQTINRKPRIVEYSEAEIAQAVSELEASEQEREESYQATRQARYDEEQAEYKAWRLAQYQSREERAQEQEAARQEYWEANPHLAPWQWRKERGL